MSLNESILISIIIVLVTLCFILSKCLLRVKKKLIKVSTDKKQQTNKYYTKIREIAKLVNTIQAKSLETGRIFKTFKVTCKNGPRVREKGKSGKRVYNSAELIYILKKEKEKHMLTHDAFIRFIYDSSSTIEKFLEKENK